MMDMVGIAVKAASLSGAVAVTWLMFSEPFDMSGWSVMPHCGRGRLTVFNVPLAAAPADDAYGRTTPGVPKPPPPVPAVRVSAGGAEVREARLRVRIDKKGVVRGARNVAGLPPVLFMAAAEQVKARWRFRGGLTDDGFVAGEVDVTVPYARECIWYWNRSAEVLVFPR